MKFYKAKSWKRPIFSGETLPNFRTEKADWQPASLLQYVRYDGALGNWKWPSQKHVKMWETSAMEMYMPRLSSFSKYLGVALETHAYDNSKPEHLGDKTNNCQTKFEKNVGR